jgi:hypothetical protein
VRGLGDTRVQKTEKENEFILIEQFFLVLRKMRRGTSRKRSQRGIGEDGGDKKSNFRISSVENIKK